MYKSDNPFLSLQRIWILLRDFEWLKLASVCLQTQIVTNSEQKQLDKELWGCLLSCCEKILKGKETFLVGDTFTISSVRHGIFLSWSKRSTSCFLVKLSLLAAGFNIVFEHPYASFSSVTQPPNQHQIRRYPLLSLRLSSSVSLKAIFPDFQKFFLSSSPGHLCSASRSIFQHRTYATSHFILYGGCVGKQY
jgi:hypothetical protein